MDCAQTILKRGNLEDIDFFSGGNVSHAHHPDNGAILGLSWKREAFAGAYDFWGSVLSRALFCTFHM